MLTMCPAARCLSCCLCRFHRQVKTQRALNDYRKSEYPHYKDELTKLKFIGSITATRLREIQAHLGDVPFICVETGGPWVPHAARESVCFCPAGPGGCCWGQDAAQPR